MSCASTPPNDEYNLAHAAMEAAKRANAAQVVPGLWSRAEHSYRKGKQAYKRENYTGARDAFERALHYAEKAENAAVIRNAREGGVE